MKFYIIAGEASGDLHASNLIKSIIAQAPEATFRAWGGDLMHEAGADVIKHYRDLAFMGFAEVIMNLRTILKNITYCKKDILAYKPDAVILIDYPGFNLRIAEFLKEQGIKVYYYISPQVWAWKKNRVHKIKRTVDKMFVILPFEKDFYKQYDYQVDYVGHPLLDAIQKRSSSKQVLDELRQDLGLSEKPIVAILPGSRKQEIAKMLPIMLKQSNEFKDYQFVIAVAPSFDLSFFDEYISKFPHVKLVENRTYDLLELAHAAMVTSGTATLEAALFRIPEVVCYKGNPISYHIARKIVDIEYISLVNLIMDKEVVKELIQSDLNHKLLKAELGKLLAPTKERKEMLHTFDLLIDKLGGGGASKKTAELILADMNHS